jgi:lipase maturation factor 1
MSDEPSRARDSYELTRALFLRVLGLVSACAFASIWVQADGLIGSRGITPLRELLPFAISRLGPEAYWRLPTLLWIDCSDATLHFLCALGFALGMALAIAARRPAFILALVWILYLSLASVGDVFLSYQWDTLLLETCFFSVGLAASAHPPRRIALFLLRWLLFRLLFLSGMVKLLSGDESWRDLSALTYHYWTQPLPTWTSAYVNDLPVLVHQFTCAATLAIELVAPLGIFGPRRVRLVSCAAIVLLQLAIALTGNYGFFNLLTLALCIPLLDDRALRTLVPATLRQRLAAFASSPAIAPQPQRARVATTLLAAILFALTSGEALERLGAGFLIPSRAEDLLSALAPLRTFNSYGLFAVMTKDRPEILIEGSADGLSWRPYEFRFKPGALDRRPRFTTPHMPRLDWQMWFAALGSCEREAWLHAFFRRLLEGDPIVLDLLATNPFPEAPPRYLRSTLWQYHFSPSTDRHHGAWWTRERVGPYCPTVTLEDGRLRGVREPSS